jgi:hypothetical protein
MSLPLSLAQLRSYFQSHQRRLQAGDSLAKIAEIARRAGVHRDTIYALLAGDRISERSQYALSRAVQEIEEEARGVPQTRLMHLQFGAQGTHISFGANLTPMLRRSGPK